MQRVDDRNQLNSRFIKIERFASLVANFYGWRLSEKFWTAGYYKPPIIRSYNALTALSLAYNSAWYDWFNKTIVLTKAVGICRQVS